ncbi:hypothetical protein GCM10027193_23320 [Arenimonas aestuarii]
MFIAAAVAIGRGLGGGLGEGWLGQQQGENQAEAAHGRFRTAGPSDSIAGRARFPARPVNLTWDK